MKNIITAIEDSEINKELKKQENIKVICKDISYKEGILEQIEKNKNIDLIIINEKIDGEISLNQLIKKIKEKIRGIEILIITEDKKKINNEICRFKNIKIYETKKIKIKKLLQNINIQNKKIEKIENNEKNIITFSGKEGVGKSVTSIIFAEINKESKTILIEFNNIENQDISFLLNNNKKRKFEIISTNKISVVKNIINKNEFENIIIDLGNKIKKEEKEFILKNSKNIILVEPNLIGITKSKKMIKFYTENLKIKKEKIFILINKDNKNSIEKNIIKNLFKEIKIIGKIENNIQYEKLINNKFNKIEANLTKKQKENFKNIQKKVKSNYK